MSEPAVLTAAARTGERERRLSFLTRGRGMVTFYARRSARPRGERSFLEPLQGGELSYAVNAGSAAGRRFTFVPQRVWPGVREDFDRTVQALAFLEIVNICGTQGEPQPALFSILVAFLDRLERERAPEVARAVATLHLLVAEGFAPQLAFCVGCGTPVPPDGPAAVAVQAGGIACTRCLPGIGERPVAVSPGAHRFMLRALVGGPEGSSRLRADRTVAADVTRFLDRYTAEKLEVQPRAAEFFRKMNAKAAIL